MLLHNLPGQKRAVCVSIRIYCPRTAINVLNHWCYCWIGDVADAITIPRSNSLAISCLCLENFYFCWSAVWLQTVSFFQIAIVHLLLNLSYSFQKILLKNLYTQWYYYLTLILLTHEKHKNTWREWLMIKYRGHTFGIGWEKLFHYHSGRLLSLFSSLVFIVSFHGKLVFVWWLLVSCHTVDWMTIFFFRWICRF